MLFSLALENCFTQEVFFFIFASSDLLFNLPCLVSKFLDVSFKFTVLISVDFFFFFSILLSTSFPSCISLRSLRLLGKLFLSIHSIISSRDFLGVGSTFS